MAIRRDAGAPTAEQSYSLICTVILDDITGSSTIEWLGPSNNTLLNSSSTTVENIVTVNNSAYERTLVFSILYTSLGGQYICRAALGQVSAVASTELLVQSVCVQSTTSYKNGINFCSFLQFHSQQSPSHPTALVLPMLALPSPSPAPFSWTQQWTPL